MVYDIKQRRPSQQRLNQAPYDWPAEPHVNVDRLANTNFSWTAKNWIWLISAIVVSVIYLTAYWFQAEAFREDVSKQFRELNNKVTVLTSQIESIVRSPTIIRVRDLREFCLLSERTNPGKFRCPDLYVGQRSTAKEDFIRGTPREESWRPRQEKP
jgi:hypothetical protein